MRNIKACLTSKSDDYKTPFNLYEWYIDRGYYDPCPFKSEIDGLKLEWKKKNFVNPPYSQLSVWVDKAIEECNKGKSVVLLIPARVDTKWFKKLYSYGCWFRFIEGRLKFNDLKSAPFPSMLVYLENYTLCSRFDLISKDLRFWEKL